jgi:hypothetical protein
VLAYGYSMQDFLEFIDGKSLPISYRDECIAIVRTLDEARLAAVHAMLTTLGPART